MSLSFIRVWDFYFVNSIPKYSEALFSFCDEETELTADKNLKDKGFGKLANVHTLQI